MLFGILAQAVRNAIAANAPVVEHHGSGNTVTLDGATLVASSAETQHDLIEWEAINAAHNGFEWPIQSAA